MRDQPGLPDALRRQGRRLLGGTLAAGALAWACSAIAQDATVCGPLATGGYGPLDYRKATAQQKELVEGSHFTREIEALQKGRSGSLAGEIDYTLRAFPNHPRALMAMMRLGERDKTERPYGAMFSVGCYFERAVRFQPDDPTARTLRGIYLLRTGQRQGAIEELEVARERAGDDPNINYNLGLAYFEMKDYDKALQHAKKAYEFGFPLEGLKNKLKRAGKWQD